MFTLLDFETTGLDPEHSEIIEIGAIRVDDQLKAVSRFHTLVQPIHPVPQMITELTGISQNMVDQAPPLEKIVHTFSTFLGDLPVVSHHSKIEQGFLDKHISSLLSGEAFSVHNSIEPLALLLPDHPSHSMESLRKWAGVSAENAHRADQDCEDLLQVLLFSQHWMKQNRPWIGALVQELLPQWWWGWFFEGSLQALSEIPPLLELLQRPDLGDLREMEKKDEKIQIPEKLSISKEKIEKALHSPDITYRDSQAQMSEKVRLALEGGKKVSIEAPTGTGKSVAYLLPGTLAAQESQSPLVVSTHSKALQDQLYEKDIPLVEKLLNRTVRVTTVKGQENYLCLRKLYAEIQVLPGSDHPQSTEERYVAAFIVALAKTSKIAELDRVSPYLRNFYPFMNRFLERVKSHHTTTLGPSCPFYKSCHFFDSARYAHQSEVVIANHSLVFHWPEHLPQLRNVIFDEAHHLEDQMTQAFTLEIREIDLTETIERLEKGSDHIKINRLIQELKLPSPYQETDFLSNQVKKVKTHTQEFSQLIQNALIKEKSRSAGGYEESIDLSKKKAPSASFEPLWSGLENLTLSIHSLLQYFEQAHQAIGNGPLKTHPTSDLISLYLSKLEGYHEALQSSRSEDVNFLRLIYWKPREALWRIFVAPISIKKLGEDFFNQLRSVTLTSATLSAGNRPTFVTDRIGIELSEPFISLPSPYPLQKQAIAFIPSDVAQPGSPAHLDSLIQFTENTAQILNGRTLLLMTANHRLKYAAEELKSRLEPHGISVFDSVSDRRAIDSFRNTEKAILIGSERYGEGVDIPGSQLSCVIIEKINETMTRGPLQEARKALTPFSLYDYDFPLRMMWLKQRVGRLIRTATDRGVIVIFDPRFHSWSAPSQSFIHTALQPIPVRGETRDSILIEIEKMNL